MLGIERQPPDLAERLVLQIVRPASMSKLSRPRWMAIEVIACTCTVTPA